ncbi:MAG: hypothetical protein R2788_22705 [Saprospiraceae bacterium]
MQGQTGALHPNRLHVRIKSFFRKAQDVSIDLADQHSLMRVEVDLIRILYRFQKPLIGC